MKKIMIWLLFTTLLVVVGVTYIGLSGYDQMLFTHIQFLTRYEDDLNAMTFEDFKLMERKRIHFERRALECLKEILPKSLG